MTELQQKILLYISKGYEAKEIAGKLSVNLAFVKRNLRKFRLDFKCRNSTELIKVLCYKGIMQQIEKEYL